MQPDYCTLFPDRGFGKDWSACCKAHDEAYGGTVARFDADRELAICVAKETGWDGLAGLMLIGVVLAGWIFRRKGKSDGIRKL